MTLAYTHYPPGFERPQKGERLRSWSQSAAGESPYYKNRPLRGPRGGDVLRLLRKPITFRNIPQLERVTVHSMVSAAKNDSAHLHVAGMVLQAITNVRVTAHRTRKSVAGFDVRAGQYLSVTSELRGEDMYHFLSKVIDVVMPKIKDWRGVKGSSGDTSGNLAFGLTGEEVALFPEVEVNYDMYVPPESLHFRSALANDPQVPAEDDTRLPCHDPHVCNERQRCKVAAEQYWYTVLWKADQLAWRSELSSM